MKNVLRIDEFKTVEGKITEVEIKFEDNSKAVFKGAMNRKGSMQTEVKNIVEWKDEDGIMKELEIIFADGSKISYRGNKIVRKGNL